MDRRNDAGDNVRRASRIILRYNRQDGPRIPTLAVFVPARVRIFPIPEHFHNLARQNLNNDIDESCARLRNPSP
jgi:hypothetical protein